MSLKQTASYQLDTSQQLINTDLDITLDNMTNNFIPNISTLGRETRPHDAHHRDNSPRVFPDPNNYPYATGGQRTRIVQDPFIPSTLRSRLSQPQYLSSNTRTLTPEQASVVLTVRESLNTENPAPQLYQHHHHWYHYQAIPQH